MSTKEAQEKAKEKAEDIEDQVEEAIEEVRDTDNPAPKAKKEPVKEEVKEPAEEKSEEAVPEEITEEPGEEDAAVTDEKETAGESAEVVVSVPKEPERMLNWKPKTKLGSEVLSGKYKSIEEILIKGELILEPEIIDALVPNLMQEVIYIGGSPGKGGGIRRTATKMTARMHKSGRRFKLAALAVIGNGDGVVGIGKATSSEHRTALEKATKNAKLSVIRVRRGCGSWECGCGGEHSIPFRVSGSAGSVEISIIPAPKGVGIVASEEVKKILKLAGIKDAWVNTSGKTSTRSNLAMAFFDALKNLNSGKGDL